MTLSLMSRGQQLIVVEYGEGLTKVFTADDISDANPEISIYLGDLTGIVKVTIKVRDQFTMVVSGLSKTVEFDDDITSTPGAIEPTTLAGAVSSTSLSSSMLSTSLPAATQSPVPGGTDSGGVTSSSLALITTAVLVASAVILTVLGGTFPL